MRHRIAPFLLATAFAACAQKKPEPAPTPVGVAMQVSEEVQAQIEREHPGAVVGSTTIHFIQPSSDQYVAMIVAAAGWAKRSVGASAGILQRPGADALWRRASEAASQRYGLRPIAPEDYSVECASQGGRRSCAMKYVAAVLQFNSVQMAGDSGFVSVGITRVPRDAPDAQTVINCVTVARNAGEWTAKRSRRVADYSICPGR